MVSDGDMYFKRIVTRKAIEWVLKKHYAHRCPPMFCVYGVYKPKEILRGIVSFGKPASHTLCEGICGKEWAHAVNELNRLVIDDDMPKNTASRLIGYALKYFKKSQPHILVSYADTGMGHVGYVYQATNWIYTGATKERTDIATPEGKHSRHYDKNQDYSKNRKIRTSKHRYVFIVANKKQKKEILEKMRYPVLPYPKGETKRYDASYRPQVQTELF